MEIIKISDIKPASYNPRRITEESFNELQGSLKTLGFILPIIINSKNMTIVAGHQRTKASTAVGITEVPAYFVDGVSLEAEVLFNQVHNGIENEPKELGKCNIDLETGKFHEGVSPYDFDCSTAMATYVKDNCKLLTEYSNVLCAIVCDGVVVFGNNYIKACQALNMKCNVYSLEASKRMMFDYYFNKNYGYFNYDHIQRADFVQGRAQMTNKTFEHSQLYQMALPFITAENNKHLSIFDFGCGKAFSITHMKQVLGYPRAIGLEFFNHNRVGISIEKGHEMIDRLIAHVTKFGLFDYVMCDSVLNSVNSQVAEDSVIACLMLFCKMGGSIFFCGRSVKSIHEKKNFKKATKNCEYDARFLDENGLTGKLVENKWYFQKFHSPEDIDRIIEKFGLDVFTRKDDGKMWKIGCKKVKELPEQMYLDAIDFEFNMNLPNNQRYGRHNDIRKLFGYPEKQ